ncbi:rhamnogalacturonan acetylesterase [Stieleria sp. JC731]|uniref:rhamnogalacturonan acetylesterase n=1 Tax=Pirellulaceae TaxID=2691357 RepID=UPI001E603379|nr:rhamnogalacturonan acetylesterase [Stieleria sp. JC731]MCC9600296.1 rhamnogalacturonan acetylesterase [Stieleria sp. JC731]
MTFQLARTCLALLIAVGIHTAGTAQEAPRQSSASVATNESHQFNRAADAIAERSVLRFDFTDAPVSDGVFACRPDEPFSPSKGFGFIQTRSLLADNTVVFALAMREGNYAVTVRFGDSQKSTSTTVKAEARRLMLENVETMPGEFVSRTFSVNVRQPEITPGQFTKLNRRELGPPRHRDWDELLTFEFGGARAKVASLEIRSAPEITTVFVAGDSTVTDQQNEPYAGWGQMLPRFFGPSVAVSNQAESGLALTSFEYQRRLEKLLSMMKPGDYVLIQFGHNDQKDKRKEAGPFTTYKSKLIEFVKAVREQKGIPILVTSMERLRMDDEGNQTPTLADYAAAARQAGAEMEVPVVDLNAMSLEFYASLGPKRATKAFVFYPAGTFPGQDQSLSDRSHHNSYGAYQLARCVVQGIRDKVPSLAMHLREDTTSFDPKSPDDPDSFSLPTSPIIRPPTKPAGN